MPRIKFKYSTWVIIVAVLGLAIGASGSALRTWSAELFPGEEPAAQTQAGGARGAASGQAGQRGTGGQAAQQGTGGQAGQGAGAATTGGGATTGARQGGAGGAGGQAGGGRTVGTVESLAGDTLTVTAQSGAVKVQLSEQTTIQKRTQGSRETTPGSRADLTAGTRVMVQGPAGEDGTVTAQTVQVLPAGAGGGQRGGGQRGGGGGGGG